MHLIGITGFIGSGKTTVGEILKDLGYVVFDMDVWCRKMYFEEDFLHIIKKNFPQTFENNLFNKRKLRNLVFSNEKELQKLEDLTHPYLKKKFIKMIHKNRFNPYVFFIESALLFKMGLSQYCSNIIITTAPYEIMEQRVIKRDKITKTDFENIFNNQDKLIEPDLSCFIINTNQKLTTLKSEILQILNGVEIC